MRDLAATGDPRHCWVLILGVGPGRIVNIREVVRNCNWKAGLVERGQFLAVD